LITAEPDGTPDGFRCDVDGNLWCGWGMGKEGLDGVAIFNPQGTLIGRIDLPERCANLCFGGRYRNRLFMAASTPCTRSTSTLRARRAADHGRG
jgi:gluconolactonase